MKYTVNMKRQCREFKSPVGHQGRGEYPGGCSRFLIGSRKRGVGGAAEYQADDGGLGEKKWREECGS
jgi:hypothetical protein